MNLIDSSTTTLRMLPVCECGQVIDDLVLDIIPGNVFFQPMHCPNFGKYIECLQIGDRYIDIFKKGES